MDGYEIRTAAIMPNIPCITTVQGLGAAVQGIEALERGEIGVRSLQDWACAGAGARSDGADRVDALRGRRDGAYRLLFDHVLTRTDAERAHHAAFRAIRAAAPADRESPVARMRRVGAPR